MEGHRTKGGMSLATKILLGLLLGAILGLIANKVFGPSDKTLSWIAENIAQTAGQIFLNLLLMVVIPLIFCSLTLGVASLGDLKRLGRIGTKALGFFVLTTALAATLGIVLVNTIKPGRAVSQETRFQLQEKFEKDADAAIKKGQEGPGFSKKLFLSFVPNNIVKAPAEGNYIGLIFFALMVGIGATYLKPEKAKIFLGFLEGFYDVCVSIIGFAMKLAPYGVAGLIFFVTSQFGFDIVKSLGLYLVTVLSGLAFHQFVVLGIVVALLGGVNPRLFFSRCRRLMLTAFSLSSSNATLPTTMKTAEEALGVPRHISNFVLPLGATMNMNGTALFEGVSVLFLAQVAGIDLTISAQVIVVVLAVLTAIGAAGVPGGSLPLITLVLVTVGVDPKMLAIILGVDRIVDMARTVPNVTGDVVCTLFVARTEGLLLVPETLPAEPFPGESGA